MNWYVHKTDKGRVCVCVSDPPPGQSMFICEMCPTGAADGSDQVRRAEVLTALPMLLEVAAGILDNGLTTELRGRLRKAFGFVRERLVKQAEGGA